MQLQPGPIRVRNILRHGLFLALLVPGCDKGLGPVGQQSTTELPGSFSGVITFQNWGALDSLYDLRLVAFRRFPPPDIIDEVLDGKAVVHPPLVTGGALTGRGTDSLSYKVSLAAGTYPYVVVALQFGPDLFNDWRPAGQYDLDTNLTVPSSVLVQSGQEAPNINIVVDFENPPPFP
jgi:hypothetical protein